MNKWMIWGENPLFSETSRYGGGESCGSRQCRFGLGMVLDFGWFLGEMLYLDVPGS